MLTLRSTINCETLSLNAYNSCRKAITALAFMLSYHECIDRLLFSITQVNINAISVQNLTTIALIYYWTLNAHYYSVCDMTAENRETHLIYRAVLGIITDKAEVCWGSTSACAAGVAPNSAALPDWHSLAVALQLVWGDPRIEADN